MNANVWNEHRICFQSQLTAVLQSQVFGFDFFYAITRRYILDRKLMNWTPEQVKIAQKFGAAIRDNKIDSVKEFCRENPWLIRDRSWQASKKTWVERPAKRGDVETMDALLKLGFSIDALSGIEKSTALVSAIAFDQYKMAEFLVEKGADLNLSRPLISALNFRKPPELRLALVKLLVENGCDVNKLYDLHGDETKKFAALDWTEDPRVIEYLRSVGAKTSKEMLNSAQPQSKKLDDFSE